MQGIFLDSLLLRRGPTTVAKTSSRNGTLFCISPYTLSQEKIEANALWFGLGVRRNDGWFFVEHNSLHCSSIWVSNIRLMHCSICGISRNTCATCMFVRSLDNDTKQLRFMVVASWEASAYAADMCMMKYANIKYWLMLTIIVINICHTNFQNYVTVINICHTNLQNYAVQSTSNSNIIYVLDLRQFLPSYV